MSELRAFTGTPYSFWCFLSQSLGSNSDRFFKWSLMKESVSQTNQNLTNTFPP